MKLKSLFLSVQIGAYANAFPPQDESATANDGLDEIRKDLDAPAYLAFAKQWQHKQVLV